MQTKDDSVDLPSIQRVAQAVDARVTQLAGQASGEITPTSYAPLAASLSHAAAAAGWLHTQVAGSDAAYVSARPLEFGAETDAQTLADALKEGSNAASNAAEDAGLGWGSDAAGTDVISSAITTATNASARLLADLKRAATLS
jgi:hypothetical protein